LPSEIIFSHLVSLESIFSVDPARIVTFAFNAQTPSLLGSLYKALFPAPPSCLYMSVNHTGELHETVIMRVLWLYTIQPSVFAYAADSTCSSPIGTEKLGNAKVESTNVMVIVMPM